MANELALWAYVVDMKVDWPFNELGTFIFIGVNYIDLILLYLNRFG